MIRFQQLRWTAESGWVEMGASEEPLERVALILVFGGREAIGAVQPFRDLQARYPDALVAGCSTAGEILDIEVTDRGLVATVLSFSATRVSLAAEGDAGSASIADIAGGLRAGSTPSNWFTCWCSPRASE
jgi:hypothetical protein